MNLSRRPFDDLSRLHEQLRLLVPVLTVAEQHPDIDLLLSRLGDTAARIEPLLAAAEPFALQAVRAGLKHATAAEHNEARSEFLAAFHRLSVLLQTGNPRRRSASDEPTKRWRPIEPPRTD
jgi:hypothetical protein